MASPRASPGSKMTPKRLPNSSQNGVPSPGSPQRPPKTPTDSKKYQKSIGNVWKTASRPPGKFAIVAPFRGSDRRRAHKISRKNRADTGRCKGAMSCWEPIGAQQRLRRHKHSLQLPLYCLRTRRIGRSPSLRLATSLIGWPHL